MINNYYTKMENKELSFQRGEKKEYILLQELKAEIENLKNQKNASNDLMVACKDDFKNTVNEQINSLKNELNFLKEEMKNFHESESNISFYPFKSFPLIKKIEEFDSKSYYISGKIPILRVWKNKKDK